LRDSDQDQPKIVFDKKDLARQLRSEEDFLALGDYLIFASKDFVLDPLNKTNHLHLVVKYAANYYKEYVLKSNNQVREQFSSAIQLVHEKPLFLDKAPGKTFIYENPEFLNSEDLIAKIENSSSESGLGKSLDNFIERDEGRSFLEKVLDSTETSGPELTKALLNFSVFQAIQKRLVSDFCQKSEYSMFIDSRTNKFVYKSKDSFEAKYPQTYLKPVSLDKKSEDILSKMEKW